MDFHWLFLIVDDVEDIIITDDEDDEEEVTKVTFISNLVL